VDRDSEEPRRPPSRTMRAATKRAATNRTATKSVTTATVPLGAVVAAAKTETKSKKI